MDRRAATSQQAWSTEVGYCFRLIDDRDKDPTVVLPYPVGGPLAATDMYQAKSPSRQAHRL